MEFGLSDEQLVLQDTARRFAKEEIAPVASHYDQSGEFPREIMRRAWELGLSSTVIPPDHGGLGLSSLDQCLLTEAANLYADAIERYPSSPLVLWGHLQLGSIYETQGLREEAYREYQKGKGYLQGEKASPQRLENWLGGDRGKIAESIGKTFTGPEAKNVLENLRGASGSNGLLFWERLFDTKIENLAGASGR